jgi:small subunit ribosomal protein S6
MYLAAPETADEDIAKLNETIGQIVDKEGGTIVRTDDMGRRKLAYPINKKNEGYYVLFEIDGSGQEIAELERRMRVNDMIMRYLTVRVDEERKTADKFQAKRDKRQAQRNERNGNSNNESNASEDAYDNQ